MKSSSWFEDGDNIFAEKSVNRELMIDPSFIRNVLVSSGCKEVCPDIIDLADAISTSSLAADPRIWPMKVIRLIASKTNAAIASSVMNICFSESVIGFNAAYMCRAQSCKYIDLIENMQESDVGDIKSLIKNEGYYWGFGVVKREKDERVTCFKRWFDSRVNSWSERIRKRYTAYCVYEAMIGDIKPLNCNIALYFSFVLDVAGVPLNSTSSVVSCLVSPCYIINALEGSNDNGLILEDNVPEEKYIYVGR